jgi:hypothetical protein
MTELQKEVNNRLFHEGEARADNALHIDRALIRLLATLVSGGIDTWYQREAEWRNDCQQFVLPVFSRDHRIPTRLPIPYNASGPGLSPGLILTSA